MNKRIKKKFCKRNFSFHYNDKYLLNLAKEMVTLLNNKLRTGLEYYKALEEVQESKTGEKWHKRINYSRWCSICEMFE